MENYKHSIDFFFREITNTYIFNFKKFLESKIKCENKSYQTYRIFLFSGTIVINTCKTFSNQHFDKRLSLFMKYILIFVQLGISISSVDYMGLKIKVFIVYSFRKLIKQTNFN